MLNITLVIFEVILYSFHISVLILLHFKRHSIFNGPFYIIFRAILFSDISCFISVSVTVPLSLSSVNLHKVVLQFCGATRMLELKIFPLSFFQSDRILSSSIYTLISVFTVIQFVGHALLALNRFTLLWFPLHQKAIWSKPWFLAILFGIPFLHNCYRFHSPGTFVVLADEKTTVALADPEFNSFHYKMAIIVYSTPTLIAAILNVLAIWKIILRKQNSALFNANEKSLLCTLSVMWPFVSLVTFCVQFIRVTYVIATYFSGGNKEILGFLIVASPYIFDIFGWSGSITLIFLSKTTREAYVAFYKLKVKKPTHISATVLSSTSPKVT